MHISDVRNFNRCPKLYRLSKQDNDYRPFPYYNITANITESVCHKLGIIDYYEGKPNEENEDTFKAFENYSWLVNSRFVYRGLRVRVPFLHIENGICDVYFSSLNLYPGDNDLTNIAWTVAVMEKAGLLINGIHLVHLNGDYVRAGELDDEKLWTVSDYFYNGKNHPSKNIMEAVKALNVNIDVPIDNLLHFGDEDIDEPRSSKCTGRNKCCYYDDCFPFEKMLPDNSILTLSGAQNKYAMYYDGIEFLKDADTQRIEGSHAQYAQIMADRQGGLFCEQATLKEWLIRYTTPVMSFVDFEWDLYPIPPYEKMKPLQVLPFQYSLDVDNRGEMKHYEYIGEGDCRREFIEKLLNDLPDEGVIFAYNAKGAEIVRLKEFQELFPEYADKIQDVIDRMCDLATPFINGLVYDVRMRGLYSLKVIQEMLDNNYTYSKLKIENGLEAVEIHRRLATADQQQKQEYYRQLYQYCGLDSYAMVEVYNWLKSLI